MRRKNLWKIMIAVFLPLTLLAQTENWVYRYNGPGNDWDWVSSIVYGADGNLYVAGESRGSGTSLDFTVISLTPEVGVAEMQISPPIWTCLLSTIFRNKITLKFSKPFQNPLKIILYNVCGSPVFEKSINNIPTSITLTDKKIKELSSGVYFLSVFSEEKNLGRAKLIKIR